MKLLIQGHLEKDFKQSSNRLRSNSQATLIQALPESLVMSLMKNKFEIDEEHHSLLARALVLIGEL
jgi:hypothetical protein